MLLSSSSYLARAHPFTPPPAHANTTSRTPANRVHVCVPPIQPLARAVHNRYPQTPAPSLGACACTSPQISAFRLTAPSPHARTHARKLSARGHAQTPRFRVLFGGASGLPGSRPQRHVEGCLMTAQHAALPLLLPPQRTDRAPKQTAACDGVMVFAVLPGPPCCCAYCTLQPIWSSSPLLALGLVPAASPSRSVAA